MNLQQKLNPVFPYNNDAIMVEFYLVLQHPIPNKKRNIYKGTKNQYSNGKILENAGTLKLMFEKSHKKKEEFSVEALPKH